MSLEIEVDAVSEVLLPDGWHAVVEKSFMLDAYEFCWDDDLIHGGGRSGICATGFCFLSAEGEEIVGPLTSILAVKSAR